MTDVTRRDAKEAKRKLPDGWQWVRLGELGAPIRFAIVDGPFGTQLHAEEYVSSGVPLIRVTNITRNGYVPNDLRFITREKFVELARSKVIPGDILIAKTGATFGKACIYPSGNEEALITSSVAKITPDTKSAVADFLVHYINSDEGYQQIAAVSTRSAQPGFNLPGLMSIVVPVPSVAEQQRIAAILSKQMAAFERARAAAEARLRAAKSLPAAHLRGLFNSPAAGTWPRMKLGGVCQLLPSKSIATDGDTEVQAITTACLTETGFAAAGVKSARMWASDASESAVSFGEVLVARSNTPDLVGRAAMYSGKPSGVVATDLTIRIWPSRDVISEFLALYLSFLYLTGYWKARAGGASGSMKKITREQIQGEEIPVPPFGEQERVARLLNGQLADIEHIRKTIEEGCGAINSLPAALLRRAFNGEL